MTTAVLDEDLVLDRAVASDHGDRRRVLRDRGHQLRAARRRSTQSGLKPAFARSTCREHGRRAPAALSSQVTSGDYDDSAEGDGGLSCLANGTTKPIRDVHVGDSVLATDPATGKTSARTVTATMAHDDDDLLDLTIVDAEGHHGALQTTDHHKIWSVTAGAWVLASQLHDGDQLREPDGKAATLVEYVRRPGHQQMLDLTIDTDHTFYVDYGGGQVLVHNALGQWDCFQWARTFKDTFGGDLYEFDTNAPILDSTHPLDPPGDLTSRWTHHVVIVKDGVVFDELHTAGMPLDEFLKYFHMDATSFKPMGS